MKSRGCRVCWRTPTAVLKAGSIRAVRASHSVTREELQRLPIQPLQLHYAPQARALRKIEGNDLVLSDAVQVPVGAKPKTARFAKLGRLAGREDPHQVSIRSVVFAHARDGICRTERMFTPPHDVTVRRDQQIQGTQVWVGHQSQGPGTVAGSDRDNRVV